MKLNGKLSTLILLSLFLLNSCGSEEKKDEKKSESKKTDASEESYSIEEYELDPSFIIQESDFSEAENFELLENTLLSNSTVNASNLSHTPENESFTEKSTTHSTQFTMLYLKKLFSPEYCNCALPSKLKKKIRKNNFCPEEVRQLVKKFSNTGIKYTGRDVISVLHTFLVIDSNGNEYRRVATSAITYTGDFNFNSLADKHLSNFAYSMDCSGYLNAAIAASGSFPLGRIDGEAKQAMSQKQTILIGGATYSSIIRLAMDLDSNGISVKQKISLLKAIIKKVDVAQTDSIYVPGAYQILYYTNSKDKKFNGSVDLNISVNAGVVSAKGSGGLKLSKSLTFSDFEVLVTDYKYGEEDKPYSPVALTDINKQIQELKKLKRNF